MDRTRGRILAALAVAAAVVGLMLLAVVAVASAPQFTFAQAHAGDRWSYSLELGEGWTFGANDTLRPHAASATYDMAWVSPTEVRLADGLLHVAARLDVDGLVYDPPLLAGSAVDDGRHWDEYRRSEWMGTDGLLAIELGGSRGEAAGSGRLAPGGIEVLETTHGVASRAIVTDFEPERGLCLADVPVAGRTLSLGSPIHVSRACHLGGVLLIEDDLWLRAGKVQTVAGVEALRFDGRGVTLWFNPAIPYPVQVHAAAAEGRGAATLRLTGFEPGLAPLIVPDVLAHRDPPPRLELATATLWGPDDQGVGTDFPLSEAFTRARDEPSFPDLREYLASHDGAFATGAQLEVEHQQSATGPVNETTGQALRWHVWLNSPTGCFAFAATREVSRAEPLPGLGPFPVGVPGAGRETTYAFDAQPRGCIEDSFGAPKPTAPQQWPTVTSALAWWNAFASPAERQQGPNGWSFQLWYEDGAWVQHLSAGQTALGSQRTTTLTSMQYAGASGTGGRLDLADGDVVSYSRVTSEFRGGQQVAGLSPPQETAAANGGSVVQSTPPLGEIGPAGATGIGFAAVLAALAYFLWPWVKGGAAAGLFSRLESSDLLQHPVRRELVQRVEAQPGIHYQDLVRRMGKGKGAIEHHLAKLEAGGLLKRLSSGGYTCWFPVAYDRRLTGAAPALKSDGARAVLAAVQAHPGSSARDVCQATGLSPAAVNHHLGRLGDAGLVSLARTGRSLSIHATELARQAQPSAVQAS